MDNHFETYYRGDLHITPRIDREELLNYIRKFYKGFSRSRYSRFITRLEDKRAVLEAGDKTLLFDPIFLH